MIVSLLVWAIVIVFLGPIYLIAFVVFGSWRLIVNLIVWKFKPNIVSSFTSRDIPFTHDDLTVGGKVRKSIINVSVLKGQLDLELLKKIFHERLLSNKFCYKMHCRPIMYLGYWFWEKTEIQINTHIFEHNQVLTDQDLKTFLPKWAAEIYPDNCPLWAVMLVKLDGNRSAIVTKYHHMLGDGVSFMKLLEHLCDGGWVHLQTPPVKSMSLIHWIYAWFTFPWNALKSYRLARIRKGFRPSKFCGEGFTSWIEMPIEKIRVIRRASKCMFQSAMGGIMSNALYAFLEENGNHPPPNILRLVIPLPYPGRSDATLNNHFGWIHTEMPMGGGLKALSKFDSNVKDSYKLGMHGVMWEFFRSMYLMPGYFLKHYTTWGEVNIPPVLLSSVPGTLGIVNIGGLEVLQSYPLLSLGCSMGINATITTYKEDVHFAIRVAKEFIPTQELLDLFLNKYFLEQVDMLYFQSLSLASSDAKKISDANANVQSHLQIGMILQDKHKL